MTQDLGRMKQLLRDALPPQYQVPIKYYYSWLRGYLEPEISLVTQLAAPGSLVIDVGANRGLYTYHLWKHGCTVIAFEPNPSCLVPLTAWGAAKRRVSIFDCALSDEDGEAELFVPIDPGGVEHDSSASLERIPSGLFHRKVIETRTLDSFCYRDVSLIKIDVEGHEQKALRGSQQTINASKPALLIEIERRHGHARVRDVIDDVERMGYSCFFLRNGSPRPISEFDEDHDQNLANLNRSDAAYINNFMFLATERLAAGEYDACFKRGA